MNSPITTHILDIASGYPARDVRVTLFRWHQDQLVNVGQGVTDSDGRISVGLIEAKDYEPGEYQIRFETAAYFVASGLEPFYPRVAIDFVVAAGQVHYHIPLLLARHGYSTYRGS